VVPDRHRALFWAERYDQAQILFDAAVAEARAQANGLVLPAVLAQRAWLGCGVAISPL
jgi:hypothetical protein